MCRTGDRLVMGLLMDELDAAMVTVIDGSLASPRCFLALREQGCVIGRWSEAFVEPERDLHAHPATVHVRGELERSCAESWLC